jgi:hypothetical protein
VKKYTIKAGMHYSLHLPKLYFGKKVFVCKVKFTESCRYDLPGTQDDNDINKLAGIGFAPYPGSHMDNSIRIGWNYNNTTGKIDLHWYVHEGGFVRYGKLDSCEIGEEYEIKLILTPDQKSFIMSTKNSDVLVSFRYPDMLVGYYLFPYFGGEPYPAPHDVELYMSFN